MVVAVFYAAVADATVRRAGRAPETTGSAVFSGDVGGFWDHFGTGGYGDFTWGREEVPGFCRLGGQSVQIAGEDLLVNEEREGRYPRIRG